MMGAITGSFTGKLADIPCTRERLHQLLGCPQVEVTRGLEEAYY